MYSLIHSFIHSCIHSFIHSSIHLFIHSSIHSFIHSLLHSFIHLCSHPLFIHSFVNYLGGQDVLPLRPPPPRSSPTWRTCPTWTRRREDHPCPRQRRPGNTSNTLKSYLFQGLIGLLLVISGRSALKSYLSQDFIGLLLRIIITGWPARYKVTYPRISKDYLNLSASSETCNANMLFLEKTNLLFNLYFQCIAG